MIDSALASAYRFARKTGHTSALCLIRARADVAAGRQRYTGAPSRVGAFARDAKADSIFVESLDDIGARLVGYADELSNLRHTGWYSDADRSEKLRGVVVQIPGKNGEARFLAAYEDSMSGAYVLDLSRGAIFSEKADSYTSARNLDAALDAARGADSFAESAGERAREYSEAWQAGQEWADAGETVADARREALAILAERRSVKSVTEKPALCAAITARVEALLEQIREARAKRDKLADSVWRDHYAAFNDGAGAVVLA